MVVAIPQSKGMAKEVTLSLKEEIRSFSAYIPLAQTEDPGLSKGD